MIYELFTGRVPFRGDSLMATVMKHLEEPPPLEGPGAERLPPALHDVARRRISGRRCCQNLLSARRGLA